MATSVRPSGFPLAKIEIDGPDRKGIATITMPEWLAKDKGHDLDARAPKVCGDVGTTKRKPLTPTEAAWRYSERERGICCICGKKIVSSSLTNISGQARAWRIERPRQSRRRAPQIRRGQDARRRHAAHQQGDSRRKQHGIKPSIPSPSFPPLPACEGEGTIRPHGEGG